MARTNETFASEFRNSNLPTAVFDSRQSSLNTKVNLRPDNSWHKEFFQRVKPLIGRLQIGQALLQAWGIFGQYCRESHTTISQFMGGDAGQCKRHTRAQTNAEKYLPNPRHSLGRSKAGANEQAFWRCAFEDLDRYCRAAVWQRPQTRRRGSLNCPKAT